jgi:hypothetical protein
MIRETLEPGSANVRVVVTPGNGVNFERRPSTDAASEQLAIQADLVVPQWLRLTRTGNTFKAEYSANGNSWTDMGSTDMPMLADVYVGLCLTSHNVNETCTAEFSNVNPAVTNEWKSQDIGIQSNITEQMYVVVQDSAGNISPIATYPAATTIGSWTEWNIPLTAFTGVNLQAVNKLSIGVGDRDDPQPGSAGDLYIDDIRIQLP